MKEASDAYESMWISGPTRGVLRNIVEASAQVLKNPRPNPPTKNTERRRGGCPRAKYFGVWVLVKCFLPWWAAFLTGLCMLQAGTVGKKAHKGNKKPPKDHCCNTSHNLWLGSSLVPMTLRLTTSLSLFKHTTNSLAGTGHATTQKQLPEAEKCAHKREIKVYHSGSKGPTHRGLPTSARSLVPLPSYTY